MDLNEKIAARRKEIAVETASVNALASAGGVIEEPRLNKIDQSTTAAVQPIKDSEVGSRIYWVCKNCGSDCESSPDTEFDECWNCRQKVSLTSAKPLDFVESISTCFTKYADFSGRASRSEYWWFFLFGTLICGFWQIVSPLMYFIVAFALFIPSLAVGARRLHDTNRSGWWQLIGITIIGIIPLVIWLASKGKNQRNERVHIAASQLAPEESESEMKEREEKLRLHYIGGGRMTREDVEFLRARKATWYRFPS